MAEREFDWPERMPEGFWIPTLQSTVRKTVTGHTLFLRGDFPYRRWEWVDLHSLGSWGAGNAVEEAYTALREHVLRQKESNMQKAHNAPQPPERAERPWDDERYYQKSRPLDLPRGLAYLDHLADRQDEILEQLDRKAEGNYAKAIASLRAELHEALLIVHDLLKETEEATND